MGWAYLIVLVGLECCILQEQPFISSYSLENDENMENTFGISGTCSLSQMPNLVQSTALYF